MKKTISDILDEAKANELEKLISQNGVPELSADTLDAIKKRVYVKGEFKGSEKKTPFIFRRWQYAACAAGVLIICAIVIASVISPVWFGIHYSAKDIGEHFDSLVTDSVETNAYTEVYTSDAEYLNIGDIPKKTFLNIYKYKGKENKLNEKEFKEFLDDILLPLADSVNAEAPQYEITEEDIIEKEQLYARANIGTYSMSASQTSSVLFFSLFDFSDSDGNKIILDGEAVQIDQRLSDKEIISSIESVKQKLFRIFGVSFKDVKVVRSFNSYSKYGASSIDIYFYNENAHPLNKTQSYPVSDYINISFDNYKYGSNSPDELSDGVFTDSSISYKKLRMKVSKEYKLVAKASRISLEQAEEYLRKGYVFGGHSCSICMAAQEKISFEGYDFVDIEYVFGRDPETYDLTAGIPFYAFYKEIGTAKNGNQIYAKTYVAAIEIDGYEEYFEMQKSVHQK